MKLPDQVEKLHPSINPVDSQSGEKHIYNLVNKMTGEETFSKISFASAPSHA